MSTPIKDLVMKGNAVGAASSTLDLTLTTLTLADAQIGWGKLSKAGSSFLDIADTPANYTGAANKLVAVNGAGNALEFITAAAGITTFTGLSDTPANYTSAANKLVRVNAGATALEFLATAPIAAGGTGRGRRRGPGSC